nr:reverse transcriptase domain-containing protein [Tanacetum cinerariifolium]
RSNRRRIPNIVEPEIRTIAKIVPMADRTMEELLQASMEGYGEAIVIPKILAENFEIKTNLIQLVQANKFHGRENDNPHTHISNFKRMTASLKYRDVPNDAIKLMLFSYSLEDRARVWACPHHGFSKLTQIDTFYNGLTEQDQDSLNAASGGNLLNKTTRESLKIIENKSKVRYSKSKSNVSRVNTNSRDVVSKTDDRIDKLADQISNLVEIVNKQVITPAKVVEKTCVTRGGAHAYYECIATDSNPSSVCAATGSYNQVPRQIELVTKFHHLGLLHFKTIQIGFQNQPFSVPNNQIPPSVPNEFSSYIKSNEIAIKSMQNQINVLRGDFNKQEENLSRNLNDDMRSILESFFQNQPSTSGTLSSNTVLNPKGEMKAVTIRSGLAYEGPSIPTESSLEKVDEQNTEEILDNEHSNSSGSTAQVEPPVVPISIPEPDVPRTQTKRTIPYPSRLNDQNLREKATNQMEKFFQIFHVLHFDISFADALLLMPKFASTIKSLRANKDKLFELAKVSLNENCSAMLLKKLPEKLGDPGKFLIPYDFPGIEHASNPIFRCRPIWGCYIINIASEEVVHTKSSNPTLVSENDSCEEPIVNISPFGESDFFSEEIDDFLNDDSIPTGIENFVYDPEGDILYFENFLKEDPFQLPQMNLNQAKSPIEEPEYSFSMRYEHFITTSVTELNEVAESSAKNLVPIPSEYEVTSDNESEYNESINDDSASESKIYSNSLFDDYEINSDELESHCLNVESNFVESLSNHDTLKFDHLEEFSGALMPIRIAEEEQIRREHAEYISLMERMITINPCPLTDTDELLPPGFENDDSEGEIYVLEELRVDNSILNSKNELFENEASDFNNPSFPRPPPEPPDDDFDFEPNSGEVISVVKNNIAELIDDKYFDPGGDIDILANLEDDDYIPFIFVIRIFLPYLIYPEVSPLLLSAESEDTIFNPGISV